MPFQASCPRHVIPELISAAMGNVTFGFILCSWAGYLMNGVESSSAMVGSVPEWD
jgi:hypothetical protein